MSYLATIPQPNDLLSRSQGQILVNFNQLNVAFSVDHIPFTNSGSTQGNHVKITFPSSPTPPTPGGTAANIYPATISGSQEMMWANATGTTQITSGGQAIWKGGTGAGVVSLANVSSNASNILTLPNGIIMIWGNFNPNSSTAVSFPGGGFTNACLNIQLTGSASNDSRFRIGISTGTLTRTGFTFQGTVDTHWTPIYYFAIGY